IDVTPSNPSIAKGTTQQFTATGTYTDSTTQNMTTQATWASANTTVATISNTSGSQGLANGPLQGTTFVSATLASVAGSTLPTATRPSPDSIAVSPTNPTIAKGATQQYSATGTYTDSSTQNITTTVNWTSANTAVATISNAAGSQGLATGA